MLKHVVEYKNIDLSFRGMCFYAPQKAYLAKDDEKMKSISKCAVDDGIKCAIGFRKSFATYSRFEERHCGLKALK